MVRYVPIVFLVILPALVAADRGVDPTFLRRSIPAVAAKTADETSATCRYKPLFGAGDSHAALAKGVARFGEITVDEDGVSSPAAYLKEEQIYFISDGSGELMYGDQK